jgi:hypothetical protein
VLKGGVNARDGISALHFAQIYIRLYTASQVMIVTSDDGTFSRERYLRTIAERECAPCRVCSGRGLRGGLRLNGPGRCRGLRWLLYGWFLIWLRGCIVHLLRARRGRGGLLLLWSARHIRNFRL